VLDQSDEEPTPYQAPTLSELEAARAYRELAAQRTVQWLMVVADGADIETFLEQLVHQVMGSWCLSDTWQVHDSRGRDVGAIEPSCAVGALSRTSVDLADCPAEDEAPQTEYGGSQTAVTSPIKYLARDSWIFYSRPRSL
jgi:hypothetical protein